MSVTGAPPARSFATAVWTGTAAIVWGGCAGPMGECPEVQGTGGVYRPADDSWTPISSDGAPTARAGAVAVWTGTEMLLFGGATTGNFGDPLDSGYAYNPATDSWRPLSTEGAPGPRADSAAEWIGDEKMLIWGGLAGVSNGFLYDPADDTWEPIDGGAGAPGARTRFAHALTGDSRLFIWGGNFSSARGHLWAPEPVSTARR
jgi:N-acetylneuraminic acid mutarotase